MRTIIVGGTGAGSPLLEVYYGGLARAVEGTLHALSRWGLDHVDASLRRLEQRLEDGESRVLLVGHSQGGLVAALMGKRRPDLVAGVISVGGPLHGTPLAPALPNPFALAVRCMARGSSWVRELQRGPYPAEVELTTVAARRDRLVPVESALLPGSHQYLIDTGHLGVILHPELTSIIKAQQWVLDDPCLLQ
jgi:triacylglycerol lipase